MTYYQAIAILNRDKKPEPMFVHEKLCRRCNDAWPVDFFRPDKRGPGYLTPWCRACEADQKREYRARRPRVNTD